MKREEIFFFSNLNFFESEFFSKIKKLGIMKRTADDIYSILNTHGVYFVKLYLSVKTIKKSL